MKDYLRRTWAAVNLDRLDHNIREIRARIPARCALMGVVKADAYGHGDLMVSRRLIENGATWLGVSNIDEAVALRKKGVGREIGILIFGDTPAVYAGVLARHGITQAVYGTPYAQALSAAAVAEGVDVDIHIKADTGMGRIGFVCREAPDSPADEIARAASLPGLCTTGIFTHFACADDPSPDARDYTLAQYARFTALCDALRARGIAPRYRHCCNSAGILRYPEMHLDMVRAGIILYGLAPSAALSPCEPLLPVMELISTISQIKETPAGCSISYGRTYQTDEPRTLATVCIGYADGYARGLSNRARMIVNGRYAKVVGRVCMDQLVLDVTGIPDVKTGDTVTVFGAQGGCAVPADELAALQDTISYEVVCLVGRRVPRVYLQGGREIAVKDDIRIWENP